MGRGKAMEQARLKFSSMLRKAETDSFVFKAVQLR